MSSEKYPNPFPSDPDRHEIWEILMRRDFEAFVGNNWSLTEPDFLENEFQGIDGGKVPNPDEWRIKYADLATYREEWLRQAAEFQDVEFRGISKLDFLFQSVVMNDIEIHGNRAMAHKKFDGMTTATKGDEVRLLWQTLYLLKKVDGHWKICGFIGYLPNPLGSK
ncbi:MAG: hypothetical protein ACK5NG_03310 [Chthoniobacterales bacterium]